MICPYSARPVQASVARVRQSAHPTAAPSGASEQPPSHSQRIHEARRYDALPPWTDPDTWLYWCASCGRSRITGAELTASSIIHIVATVNHDADNGQQLVSHLHYGGGVAATAEPAR